MKNVVSVAAGCMILVGGWAQSSAAQDKVQAFRAADGKIVFTNLVENPPGPIPAVKAAEVFSGAHTPIHALIETISNNHGVDPMLVRAIVKTESNYNRWAVSSKGALGLMQLIPPTGVRFGVRDFYDPKQNIEGGVRYIKFLLDKFNGNLDLSLAAYNAGENLVERLGRIPLIPETREYVRRVRANYAKSPNSTRATVGTVGSSPKTDVAREEASRIFRIIDERGVVHFSNVAPPK